MGKRIHDIWSVLKKWRTVLYSRTFLGILLGPVVQSPIKGEVSRKFDVISKPRNVCLRTETKIYCLVLL